MSATSFLTEGVKLIESLVEYWKWSKRPFKPDLDRYQQVMENINIPDIYYFREIGCLYHDFSADRYSRIGFSACALSTIRAPKFIDKKLHAKEQKLLDALKEMWALMRGKLHFNRERTLCTIYGPDYNATNPEHEQKALEVIAELNQALNQLIEAFEDFRDYGNERFAVRLSDDASLINRE